MFLKLAFEVIVRVQKAADYKVNVRMGWAIKVVAHWKLRATPVN